MARGDQIYVMRPLMGMQTVYQHHGIDCGDGTVIHYYKGGDEAVISRTAYATFSQGNPVYTYSPAVAYIPDVVIERAESRLGERRYNLMTNNCEHFATWCKTGRNESQQLSTYGLDASQIKLPDVQQLIRTTEEEVDPAQAIAQFQTALDNVAIARSGLQTQYSQAQREIDTWHRAAQLALKQGKEALARAALERKVKFKRQSEDLNQQLAQLTELQNTLDRNRLLLQRQIL